MIRTLTATLVLLSALVAWGCSGADDASDQPAVTQLSASDFQVTSQSFTEIRPRKRIPKEHTCFGANLSPPLSWSNAPPGTKSLALVVDEPENDTGPRTHWVLYHIPAEVAGLPEGIPTSTDVLLDGTKQGTNDYSSIGYSGPCPPPVLQAHDVWDRKKPTAPPHKYYFRVYALDAELDLAPGANRADLVSAIEGHILAQAETIGKYITPVEVKVFDSE